MKKASPRIRSVWFSLCEILDMLVSKTWQPETNWNTCVNFANKVWTHHGEVIKVDIILILRQLRIIPIANFQNLHDSCLALAVTKMPRPKKASKFKRILSQNEEPFRTETCLAAAINHENNELIFFSYSGTSIQTTPSAPRQVYIE